MICPKCGFRTNVYQSRSTEDGEYVRWRKCPECEHRFITIERVTNLEIQGGCKRGGRRVAIKHLLSNEK